MKRMLWVAIIGALLAAPYPALAQQSPLPSDPADPGVAVPPVTYASAFEYRAVADARAPQSEATPDKLWRPANDAVGGANAHAGHSSGNTVEASPAPPKKPVHQPATDHGKHH